MVNDHEPESFRRIPMSESEMKMEARLHELETADRIERELHEPSPLRYVD